MIANPGVYSQKRRLYLRLIPQIISRFVVLVGILLGMPSL
jgi:hypothetical protein